MWFWIVLGILVFLAAVLLFLLFPAVRKHADLELMNGALIAHRGLHDCIDDSPENSLPAFRNAVEHGYAIENDIHLTADGEVVVFHDDDFKRMCGLDKKPEEMTLREIRELRLGNSDEMVPTLQECLDVVQGKVFLLIEFKSFSKESSYRLCEKANEILETYTGKYMIQSFYPFVLKWYRKYRPDVCRGQLSSAFYHEQIAMKLLGCLVFNFLGRPDFISYEYAHRKNFFRRFCAGLGAFPVCWTLHSQEELDTARSCFKTYIFELFVPSDANDQKRV